MHYQFERWLNRYPVNMATPEMVLFLKYVPGLVGHGCRPRHMLYGLSLEMRAGCYRLCSTRHTVSCNGSLDILFVKVFKFSVESKVQQLRGLRAFRTEWMIYAEQERLAGSIDFVAIDDKGELHLFDWKRSKETRRAASFPYSSCASLHGHQQRSAYVHSTIPCQVSRWDMYSTSCVRTCGTSTPTSSAAWLRHSTTWTIVKAHGQNYMLMFRQPLVRVDFVESRSRSHPDREQHDVCLGGVG